ncbi:sigma-70 family RNA polymerase sigma factor [Photorhabdus laumondii]|uniref:sigma-70 family RNA polymerase sigma factor n=2 Tax=Photorhabdus laumondii TaxID=2218628 RepID=UPI0009E1C410
MKMTVNVLDTQQIQWMYVHNHDWLFRWLKHRLNCDETAADLTQDTFVKLLRSPLPQQLNEPRAYIVTIAKGLMVNWYRRSSLEQSYLDLLVSLPEPLIPAPEQKLIILETLQEIDIMLSQLPTPVQTVFLLSQIEGMKYEDIANQMNISLSTVKRYMKQGFYQCLIAMA